MEYEFKGVWTLFLPQILFSFFKLKIFLKLIFLAWMTPFLGAKAPLGLARVGQQFWIQIQNLLHLAKYGQL